MGSDFSNLNQKLSEINSVVSNMLNQNHDFFDHALSISTQDFLGWIDPEKLISHFEEYSNIAKKYEFASYEKIFVIGMGGSSLGARVLIDNFLRNKKREVYFVDTYHPEFLRNLWEHHAGSEIMFLVCSKSGNTLETLMIFEYFYQNVQQLNKNNSPGQSFIAITDQNSRLDSIAQSKNFAEIVYGVKEIGGRYSVLSCFGMFPALMSGVDSSDLIEALRDSLVEFRESGYFLQCEQLIKFILEGLINDEDKIFIDVDPQLSGFSEWIQQLIAESLGKNHKGIVPLIHNNYLEVYNSNNLIFSLKQDSIFSYDVVKSPLGSIFEVQLSNNNDLISQLFVWEIVVASLGVLTGTNPFDQPDVQLSKNETNYFIESNEKIEILDNQISIDELIYCFENLDKNGYVSFLYFTNPQSNVPNLMNSLAYTLSLKFHIPVIQAIGPNYLHSLGQLFKGGPDKGTFIQFVSSNVDQDIQVPHQNFSFYDLMNAQIQGEHKILNLIDRNPLVVNLGNEPEKKLEKFIGKVKLDGF